MALPLTTGLLCLLMCARLAFTVPTYIIAAPVDLFGLLLSEWIPILFPVIIVYLGAIQVSSLLSHRFIVNVRSRIDVRTYLLNGFVRSTLIAFFSFFIALMLCGVFAFYIAPAFHVVTFDPTTYVGLDAMELRDRELRANTYAALLRWSPIAFMATYAAIVACYASVWTMLAFTLVLVVPQRYVALSLPFLVFHLGNFASGLLGVPQFSPLSAIFPFNITAQPWWTVLVPVTVVATATAGLAATCWIKARNLENLA